MAPNRSALVAEDEAPARGTRMLVLDPETLAALAGTAAPRRPAPRAVPRFFHNPPPPARAVVVGVGAYVARRVLKHTEVSQLAHQLADAPAPRHVPVRPLASNRPQSDQQRGAMLML